LHQWLHFLHLVGVLPMNNNLLLTHLLGITLPTMVTITNTTVTHTIVMVQKMVVNQNNVDIPLKIDIDGIITLAIEMVGMQDIDNVVNLHTIETITTEDIMMDVGQAVTVAHVKIIAFTTDTIVTKQVGKKGIVLVVEDNSFSLLSN